MGGCFDVAEKHEKWIQWAVDLCRNFLRAGWEDAAAVLHQENLGSMLASLVEDTESAILRSVEATTSIANCIASAAYSSDRIAAQMVSCDAVVGLIKMLERHQSSNTGFYIAQAIRLLVQSSSGTRMLRQASIVASLARHFKSNHCKANARYQLSVALSRLDDGQLTQRGITRAALQRAQNGYTSKPMAPARTSLADSS